MNLDVFYKNNSAHFGRTALFEGDIERKGNETEGGEFFGAISLRAQNHSAPV